jgi:hypothetical protein
VQVWVAEQSIDGLDVVLNVRAASSASPELGERRLAAEHERLHDADERPCSLRMPNNRPLLEPS